MERPEARQLTASSKKAGRECKGGLQPAGGQGEVSRCLVVLVVKNVLENTMKKIKVIDNPCTQ